AAVRPRRPRTVMEDGDAPDDARLVVGARELPFEPGALGAAVPLVHRVEEEEARVPPAERAIELRLVALRRERVAERTEVTEVRLAVGVDKLVVADARKDGAIAQERRFDVEEELPIPRVRTVLDEVAGVEEEVRRGGAHRADDAGVAHFV